MKHITEPIGILESHLYIAYASTVYILQVTGHLVLTYLYGDVFFIYYIGKSEYFIYIQSEIKCASTGIL